MQVNLKQKFLDEQVRTVINSITDTTSLLTVAAVDGDVCINRPLFVLFSPFLRSILGSVPSADHSSALLILPVHSKPLLHLQKILVEASLDNLMLEVEDIDEVVEVCSLLGVYLTKTFRNFEEETKHPEDDGVLSIPSSVSLEVDGNMSNVDQHVVDNNVEEDEDDVESVQIKIEPVDEYKEMEQGSQLPFPGGSLKEETRTIDKDLALSKVSNLFTKKDFNSTKALLTKESSIEEGEIDIVENEILQIDVNEKEIGELLNATKTEIEKYLIRKPIEHSLEEENLSSPGIEESSTSVKANVTAHTRDETDEDSRKYLYPCNLCSYKTNVGLSIKKHVKSVHKCFYTFSCQDCKYSTSSEQQFKLHACGSPIDVGVEANFQCSLCTYKTHMPDFIQVHMKNIHDSYYIFKCSRCSFESSRFHKLSSHECTIPSNSKTDPVVGKDSNTNLCMRCGKYHATPCTRPEDIICEYPDCGKIGHSKSLHYPSTVALYNAIQLRDSSLCLELPPTGKDKTAVKKSKAQLYPCKDCGYKTNKASMIKYHTRKSHQSQYMFSCTICMFSTTDNKMFPSHKCKEELIQCPQCDFTASKTLLIKRHIATQHEAQVYSCGQCAYKCTTLDSFQKHQLLLCQGYSGEVRQSRSSDRELFFCDRCDYEGRNIDSLIKHKTTFHTNITASRQRSRSPNVKAWIRRSEAFSPVARSPAERSRKLSRPQRTPSHCRQRSRSSSRSHASSRGPTTPFPPSPSPYDPASAEERYGPSRTNSNSGRPAGPGRKRGVDGKGRQVLLCLRCGRRHQAECKHPADSWCSQQGCGRTGHVITLHHPKTMNDYKLIRAKMPGFSVNEPKK